MTAVSGTLLAFDFGELRIGVAVGETSTRIANPLKAIDGRTVAASFEAIGDLVREWSPTAFVVGKPRHPDGSAHEVAIRAEKFARRLRGRYNLPVFLVDETLTSVTAEATLRETRTHARRDGEVDALAATLILQAFLDDPDSRACLPTGSGSK